MKISAVLKVFIYSRMQRISSGMTRPFEAIMYDKLTLLWIIFFCQKQNHVNQIHIV